jgi:signal transduction histidine kinase
MSQEIGKKDLLQKELKACELQLEDVKALSSARERLLLSNIKELDEVYRALRDKIQELRERDTRIRSFDEVLTRANRLSALGELAASIAHEIKNPLISIQGFAKRIEGDRDSERIERYAQYIEKESERLSTVLMRLLDFSRMSEPNVEHLDLNSVVDDTILFTEHHLTRFRNVQLVVEQEHDLPGIRADKIHIQQALVNIMINAAQSMPEGGPVTVKTGKRDDGYVWISVSDRGKGIEAEHLSHIFEPFFTTKAKGEGTGLGLSLTKKLVEANRGKIEVESVRNQGTTFRVVLPIAEESQPQDQSETHNSSLF